MNSPSFEESAWRKTLPHDQSMILRTIARITRELVAAEPSTIFDLVCRRAAELLDTSKSLVAVQCQAESDMSCFSIRGSHGLSDLQNAERELQESFLQGKMPQRSLDSSLPFAYERLPGDISVMQQFCAQEGIQSFAAAPLLIGDNETGLLMVFDQARRDWSSDEIELLKFFADQATVALQKLYLFDEIAAASRENARLYETERRRSARLAALHRISAELAVLRDESAVLNALARYVAELSGVALCAVMLVDDAGCVTKVTFPIDVSGEALPESPVKLSVFVAEPLYLGTPVILTHIDRDAAEFRLWFKPEAAQTLCLYPLRSENGTFGFLTVLSSTPRAPSPAEVSAFLLLAERAAAALENARLHAQLAGRARELQQRSEQLTRLYRASGALMANTTAGLPSLGKTIVSVVLREFGQSNCSLILVQEDMQELKRIAVDGPYAETVRRIPLSINGRGLIAKSVRTAQILNVPDVSKNEDYLANWPKARSELTLPLKIGSQVIGAIDIQSAERNAFSEQDARVMGIFAEQAALALEHNRLYEKTVQSLQHLTALRTIDQAISSTLDLPSTLNVLLEQVVAQLQVDAAAILLLNEAAQVLEFAAGRGFREKFIYDTRLHLGQSYAGRVAMERRSVGIANRYLDTENLPEVFATMQDFEGFVAYYATPLIAKERVKGVLEVYHRAPYTFTSGWLDYLDTLAQQASIAIDNASLVNDLQRSNTELIQAYETTLKGWSHALDLRDEETEDHTQRVTELTERLARRMGIGELELVHFIRGALLHDIGKMGTPDRILHKTGPLTEVEKEVMVRHPLHAFEMLSPIAYLRPALDIPYCHHEKWDGSGYPRRLKGEEIPLSARIFAIVDVWDALCSDRHYRAAWPREQALAYILEQRGRHFDPHVVDAFVQMMKEEQW